MKCPKCGDDNRDNVKFCIKCGVQLQIDAPKQDQFQLVTRLIMENKSDELRQILDSGCYNVNSKDVNGATVICNAIHYKNVDAFELLVRHGADVNIKTNHGITPLMVAASAGNLTFVELLVKLNVNVFDKDHRGKMAADYATERNFAHIAEYLANLSNNSTPPSGNRFQTKSHKLKFKRMLIAIITGVAIILGGIYAVQNYDWAFNVAKMLRIADLFSLIASTVSGGKKMNTDSTFTRVRPGDADVSYKIRDSASEGRSQNSTLPSNDNKSLSSDQNIVVKLGGGITLEMVKIAAGTFERGPNNVYGEKPHTVCITESFYIGKYEVTLGQWKQIMKIIPEETGERKLSEAVRGKAVENNSSNLKSHTYPVGGVSWYDCQKFIKNLNGLNKTKFRLPTEAEWEYACRGGTDTKFYWGDNMNGDYCWYEENSGNTAHPVGQKLPNAFGLYDMSGNVREWCNDWFKVDYYSNSPTDDPPGPPSAGALGFKVHRGGSFAPEVFDCQSGARCAFDPSYGLNSVGFRLALDASSGIQLQNSNE